MDMNTAVSLHNIKEDLLNDEAPKVATHSKTKVCAPAKKIGKARAAKTKIVKAEIKTFDRLLTLATKKLGCTVSELKTWLNQIPDTPETVQHNALRLIVKHGLDPLSDEIPFSDMKMVTGKHLLRLMVGQSSLMKTLHLTAFALQNLMSL